MARPAAAKAPKPASAFVPAPAEIWTGPVVVDGGDTGVLVALVTTVGALPVPMGE